MKFDWWLTGICSSRVFSGLVFMTYAAALPILQKEWQMSSVAAGSIASGFQIGYALSLITFSTLADRISPKVLYLWSNYAGALFSLVFALIARGYLSALGDSPAFSAALTEVVETPYLGVAFGLRSLLGFGAGAISPLLFGAVLDWTNPIASTHIHYEVWGWSFSILGVGGLGATWTAYRFRRMCNKGTIYDWET